MGGSSFEISQGFSRRPNEVTFTQVPLEEACLIQNFFLHLFVHFYLVDGDILSVKAEFLFPYMCFGLWFVCMMHLLFDCLVCNVLMNNTFHKSFSCTHCFICFLSAVFIYHETLLAQAESECFFIIILYRHMLGCQTQGTCPKPPQVHL